jgi:NAD(P)H-dependent FMN reductase
MKTKILLICGSSRAGSVNAAVLNTVQHISPPQVETRSFQGLTSLPHFNPDDDAHPLNHHVTELRKAIRESDGILFCTPEYAGGLPGSFKNLLDWTVGGTEMNMKAVGWINAASHASPARGEDAHASLRKVLGYVGASIVEPACLRLPIRRQEIGLEGLVDEPNIRLQIAATITALADAATAMKIALQTSG